MAGWDVVPQAYRVTSWLRTVSPLRAEATAAREEKAWRIVHPETAGRDGSTLSWRVAVPWDDRDTFTEMAARHLGCYGRDAAAWPGEITAAMTIPRVRNATPAGTEQTRRSGCTRPPG